MTIELLRGHIAALEQQVRERDEALREAHLQIELLRFTIARLHHELHGDKSERFAPDEHGTQDAAARDAGPETDDHDAALATETQQAPLEGADGDDAAADDEDSLWPRKGRVREHERTIGRPGKRKHLEVDPSRVTDEHRHLYPDARSCACCGRSLTEIGEETSTRIEREPVRFRRIITHRHKMACASCRQGGVSIARPDDPPIFGAGGIGTSFAADIVLMHHADHLPFHRMMGIFAREGLRVDRATLSRVSGRVADVLARIVEHMESELLASDRVLGIDGTGLKILARPHCARREVYVIHDQRHVVFRFLSRKDARSVLRGFDVFRGVAMADAATVHTGTFAASLRLVVALCNAHARRKFHEARETDVARADHVLRFYRRVALLERSWADLSPQERQREREAMLAPSFEALRAWAEQQQREVMPRTPMRGALDYLLSHWEGLTLFLRDGRIPWTNNASERLLRHIAVGRRAWMFRGTSRGARRACVLWSLVMSCRALGIDPRRYLIDTLDALEHTPRAQLGTLTPKAYAARQHATLAAA